VSRTVNRRQAEPGLCSIVLPTYNRADFLPDAVAAIRTQQYAAWELIVVDDGSTDDTRARIAALAQGFSPPTRYVYQQNRGPGAARNRGIELTRGEFIAFYDSDDLWLPHHLSESIDALRATPELTWVYSACRVVELRTNRVLEPSSFYVAGQPRPFFRLQTRKVGALKVILDPSTCRCAIDHGLYIGLQTSVLRRRIFDAGLRLPDLRIAEDRCLTIQALKRGAVVGYFDDVHVVRRIHAANLSFSRDLQPLQRGLDVAHAVIEAYELLQSQENFEPHERRALRRRIARERFWKLGYRRWQEGCRAAALEEYRQAMAIWPWDPSMLKTYVVACMRTMARRNAAERS
jgi:glycosyltransferase involved in cell wall biosynthesis